MGKIGHGYGSEWHLLRYLGYHRLRLQEEILSKTGGDNIQWLDFRFSNINKSLNHDRELKGVEFLDEYIKKLWRNYWPQTGNVQNWDAVGQLLTNDKREWLLVEAKSHVGELRSDCCAKSKSRQKIIDAMEQAMRSYHAEVIPVEQWLSPYYQFCNRLAMLHFLNFECDPTVSANLVMIYFYGDRVPYKECPNSPAEWKLFLGKLYQEVGLVKQSELMKRIHTIYLPVNPNVVRARARP